ncbi:MAG: TRAM domain-containing protein, partial [Oscillospiraceae bacterium]|nr:TRAM domain-containing protein [Oscillospiraceae bacterium]
MKKNDIIKLEITGTTSEGNGVGHYEGMAIFVPASAEGDVLSVLIVKVKKSYAYGKIVDIISPSTSRVEDNCELYLKCGGCVFRHIDYQKECEIKRSVVENNLKRIGGFDISVEPIISDKSEKYRNKAQYPIGLSKEGKVLAGFFAPHSHRVVDNACCSLQPD